jgi:hypothetical protein
VTLALRAPGRGKPSISIKDGDILYRSAKHSESGNKGQGNDKNTASATYQIWQVLFSTLTPLPSSTIRPIGDQSDGITKVDLGYVVIIPEGSPATN